MTNSKFLSSKTSIFLLGTMFLFASCDDAPKGDKATITDEMEATEVSGMTFMVDTSESTVRFTGHGVGKNHPGKFKVSSGTVAVENNQITGGEFLIDIQSMNLEEEGDHIHNKLRPHLMSGDFFDAENFNSAKFEITEVRPYEPAEGDTSLVEGANYYVSGNFTLRDVTKNITFPARIELDDNQLEAEANFDIDRTQWQMNYGNDKTLGDQFISETVNIELDLEADAEGNLSAEN